MNIYIQTKTCTKCKIEKRISEFGAYSASNDGFRASCKSCNKEYVAKNKEKIREYRHRHYSENMSYYKEYDKIAYQLNGEKRKQTQQRWRKSNKPKQAMYKANYRAAKLQATPGYYPIQHSQVQAIYAEANRLTKETGIQHHVDHDAPLQSDLVCGIHCLANLRIITAAENLSKSNRTWADMPDVTDPELVQLVENFKTNVVRV